jgi:hypothetical protein
MILRIEDYSAPLKVVVVVVWHHVPANEDVGRNPPSTWVPKSSPPSHPNHPIGMISTTTTTTTTTRHKNIKKNVRNPEYGRYDNPDTLHARSIDRSNERLALTYRLIQKWIKNIAAVETILKLEALGSRGGILEGRHDGWMLQTVPGTVGLLDWWGFD